QIGGPQAAALTRPSSGCAPLSYHPGRSAAMGRSAQKAFSDGAGTEGKGQSRGSRRSSKLRPAIPAIRSGGEKSLSEREELLEAAPVDGVVDRVDLHGRGVVSVEEFEYAGEVRGGGGEECVLGGSVVVEHEGFAE